jgi:hypothetical protein
MSGLRPIATAIAAMMFAAPLLGQSATTVGDTTALGRLPVSVTAAARAIVVDVRPPALDWTTAETTTTPAARLPATWSNGAGSRATAAAMMIVGGAGLLVGTVVSGKPGTRIMIGGGLLGLVGLWRYERNEK